MKTILLSLILALTFAANAQKISDLTETTATGTNDLLYLVKPSGTNFLSRKITVKNHRTDATFFGKHSEGRSTATGNFAHAEGYDNTASGEGSHAEGASGVNASGIGSHAEGNDSGASGDYAHAEGQDTSADGPMSHTQGQGTHVTTNGYAAHAQGFYTTASAPYAIAAGDQTTASGTNSFAFGAHGTASGFLSVLFNLDASAGPADTGSTGSTVENSTDKSFMVNAPGGFKLLGGQIEGDGGGLWNLSFTNYNRDQFHLEGSTLTAGAEIAPHYFNVTNLNASYLLARPQDGSGDIAIFSDFGGAGRSYIRPDGTFEGPHRVVGADTAPLAEGTALIDSGGNIYSSGGGLTANQVYTTTNLTLTTNMTFIGVPGNSGVTLTLPPAAPGHIFYIKRKAGSTVTWILPDGTDTIDGANTPHAYSGSWQSIFLIGDTDGTGWWIF